MLHRWDRLDVILPEKDLPSSEQSLRTYWSRYRSLYPQHEIFDILSNEELDKTVPIKLHGDEGRSTLAFDLFKCGVVAGHVLDSRSLLSCPSR